MEIVSVFTPGTGRGISFSGDSSFPQPRMKNKRQRKKWNFFIRQIFQKPEVRAKEKLNIY